MGVPHFTDPAEESVESKIFINPATSSCKGEFLCNYWETPRKSFLQHEKIFFIFYENLYQHILPMLRVGTVSLKYGPSLLEVSHSELLHTCQLSEKVLFKLLW